jgi:phosphate transport system substrate-binding protein
MISRFTDVQTNSNKKRGSQMKKWVSILMLAGLAALPALAANDDLAVVVNKTSATGSLTKSQLRKLILGEQGTWPSGEAVTVVMSGPGHPERDGILKGICRMTEADYYQYFVQLNTGGQKVKITRIVADSPATMRQLVSTIPGAIGFLALPDVNDSVKSVSVDGVAAGSADYKIKVAKK